MNVNYGDKCPNHDWVTITEKDRHHCDNCRGLVYRHKEGVECRYSEKPTTPPKYSVGQEKWRLEYGYIPDKSKIRLVGWDGFEHTYTFARERHSYKESEVFDARIQAEERHIQNEAKQLIREIESFKERYNCLPVTNIKLLKDE